MKVEELVMHMSDALLSPIVGGTMLATSGGTIGYSVRQLKMDRFEKKLPLMAVMGAFLFAAQMINFAIPGTGSSGHIGGGVLLAIILGPAAGFLTMACVLFIQALFFADGGYLALGCNLINLGFFTCYVAYPLVFRKLIAKGITPRTIMIGAVITSVIGLQLGSLGVVAETFLSGRTELTLGTFILFMQPIHLVIGLVEGVITGVIINYLYAQNTEMIYRDSKTSVREKSIMKILVMLMIVTLLIGGGASLMASSSPDGLEWAIFKTANVKELMNEHSLIEKVSQIQEKFALLPDYSFKEEGSSEVVGISMSGILGSLMTLGMTLLLGVAIQTRVRMKKRYRHEQDKSYE